MLDEKCWPNSANKFHQPTISFLSRILPFLFLKKFYNNISWRMNSRFPTEMCTKAWLPLVITTNAFAKQMRWYNHAPACLIKYIFVQRKSVITLYACLSVCRNLVITIYPSTASWSVFVIKVCMELYANFISEVSSQHQLHIILFSLLSVL